MSDSPESVIAEALGEPDLPVTALDLDQARDILTALREARYAVVKLPEPCRPGVWRVIHDGEPEDVYIGPRGGVTLSGVETFDERDVPGIAAALLAAAAKAEEQAND